MNSALREFKEKDTDVHLNSVEVSQFNLRHLREFDEQWVDLDLDFDSLGYNCQEGHLVANRANVPGVVWEIGDFWLQVSDWGEFPCTEEEPSFFPIELQVFNELGGPDALLLVPHSDLNFIILSRKDGVSKLILDGDGISLDLRIRLRVRNLFQGILN